MKPSEMRVAPVGLRRFLFRVEAEKIPGSRSGPSPSILRIDMYVHKIQAKDEAIMQLLELLQMQKGQVSVGVIG